MASFQMHTDPLVTCPYNPAHRLKRSRMQIHLTKCKKNHVELDLRECPYNAQHRIPHPELAYHMSVCPERRLVDRQVVHASDGSHQGNTTVPSYKAAQPAVDEYWDEISSTRPGYDPRKKLESGNFILIPKGQPVDRRNAYKKMFTTASLNNGEINASGYNENCKPTPPSEVKPIRVPKATPEVLQMNSNLGRGQQPTVRRKIAANIFGGNMGTAISADNYQPVVGHGALPGMAVGLGRGLGRGRPGIPGGHPPLAPGQVQYLE